MTCLFPRMSAVFLSALALTLPCSSASAQPTAGSPVGSKAGVTVNDPRAFRGYSLVAPMTSTTTYLLDMDGRVVHTWTSDYTPAQSAYLLENGHLLRPAVIRNGRFGGNPASGGRIQEFSWDGKLLWDFTLSTERNMPHHDVCPMPNGNVLVIASDKKTAAEAIAAGRHPKGVQGQLLPDCIFEVHPTGKTTGEIVWQWHAWDHLVQDIDKTKANFGDVSEHPELIDVNFGTGFMASLLNDPKSLGTLRSIGYVGGAPNRGARGDAPSPSGGTSASSPGRGVGAAGRDAGGPGMFGAAPFGDSEIMHTNSVAYNADLDQIMLSIHNFSEVWIIDHSTTTTQAATHRGGKSDRGGDLLYRWGNPRAYRNGSNADQRLFGQHCAKWIRKGLPGEGHLLVFNNGALRPDGTYSSVDEVVLPVDKKGRYAREEFTAFGPQQATWSYAAPNKTGFYSMAISGAQRLPNGNTFICSGVQGTLFEVTPDKDIVWNYSLPRRSSGSGGILGGLLNFVLGGTPAKAGATATAKPAGTDGSSAAAAKRPPDASPTAGGGGPGGGPGGMGGIFTCNRYAPDHPALVGKDLTPDKKLGE